MAEERTLELVVRAKDFASGVLRQIAIGALRQIGAELTAIPRKLAAFGSEMIEEADAAQKMAAALQTSTESLTALQFAAGQAGIGQSELQTSSKALLKSIEQARDGARDQSEAFERLGIDSRTLARDQVDLVDIFAQVADGVQSIEDPVQRANTLLKVFGRSGNDLANLFNEGSEGIRAMARDAKELGAVLDTDFIKKADAAGDELQRLNTVVKGIFRDFLKQNLGEFTAQVNRLVEFIKENREAIVHAFQEIAANVVRSMDVALRAVIKLIEFGTKSLLGWRLLVDNLAVGFLKVRGLFVSGGEADINTMATRAAQQQKEQTEEQLKAAGELSEAYARMLKDLSNINRQWTETNVQAEKHKQILLTTPGFAQGLEEGVAKFKETLFDVRTEGQQLAIEGLTGIRDFTAGVIFSLTTGAQNFRATIRSITADILRMFAQIASQAAANSLLRGLFTGLGGAAAGAGAGAGGGGGDFFGPGPIAGGASAGGGGGSIGSLIDDGRRLESAVLKRLYRSKRFHDAFAQLR